MPAPDHGGSRDRTFGGLLGKNRARTHRIRSLDNLKHVKSDRVSDGQARKMSEPKSLRVGPLCRRRNCAGIDRQAGTDAADTRAPKRTRASTPPPLRRARMKTPNAPRIARTATRLSQTRGQARTPGPCRLSLPRAPHAEKNRRTRPGPGDRRGRAAHGSAYDQLKQTRTTTPTRYAWPCAPCAELACSPFPACIRVSATRVPAEPSSARGSIQQGKTHTHRYLRPPPDMIPDGQIDPSYVVAHRVPLTKAPDVYEIFCEKKDDRIKVVPDPRRASGPDVRNTNIGRRGAGRRRVRTCRGARSAAACASRMSRLAKVAFARIARAIKREPGCALANTC